MSTRNLAASVRARLLAKAKAQGANFNLLLTRYAVERLLYRLSISEYGKSFVLKGALLFDVWFAEPHRPTHDADLLGLGNTETQHLKNVFAEVCKIECADGIVFNRETIRAARIRKNVGYAGVRVTLMGVLDGARCNVQIDVGFGDAVFPAPERISYPPMLEDMPAPQLHAYTRYTVVAEKFSAMVQLGNLNSRLKDYYDIRVLSMQADFDGALLAQAIQAAFARLGLAIPAGVPDGLRDGFCQTPHKMQQWAGFLKKNALAPLSLQETVVQVREFLLPVLAAIEHGQEFRQLWQAGGTWQ